MSMHISAGHSFNGGFCFSLVEHFNESEPLGHFRRLVGYDICLAYCAVVRERQTEFLLCCFAREVAYVYVQLISLKKYSLDFR